MNISPFMVKPVLGVSERTVREREGEREGGRDRVREGERGREMVREEANLDIIETSDS